MPAVPSNPERWVGENKLAVVIETAALNEQEHKIRPISPQFAKPCVKSKKNDRNDAEAICETVSRKNMRFVKPGSIEQQDVQALHRIRSRLVGNRTAMVNQIRDLLHGARFVIRTASRKDNARTRRVKTLVACMDKSAAAVAIVNKDARIAWALLARHCSYCEEA